MNHTDEAAAAASWAKEEYLVALKLLLRDGDKLLLVKDQWDQWDIPGGRIRKDQFEVSPDQILREKVDVEIGESVQYELGDIKLVLRVARKDTGRGDVRIFAVAYEGKYLGGDIELGEYGQAYEWVDLKSVDLSKYDSSDGWIPQLADYVNKYRGSK